MDLIQFASRALKIQLILRTYEYVEQFFTILKSRAIYSVIYSETGYCWTLRYVPA